MGFEIHVFGADQGESILLRFPNDRWGVVDCYAATNRPESNELLKFLLDHQVKELHFACLTHPHKDHYSGLMHVIEALPVRQFWYPAVMTRDLLGSIAKLEYQQSKASSDAAYDDSLITLWEKITELHRRSEINIRKVILGGDLGTEADLGGVRIVGLAPSSDEAFRFERTLVRNFEDATFSLRKAQASVNRCSIALALFHEKQRIVLGGDVEKRGWADLLDQQKNLAADISVVKVAHHGSINGRCEGLWETHAGNVIERLAVLTPFCRHRLPSQKVIAEIQAAGYKLFSTSKIAKPKKADEPEQAIAKVLNGSSPILDSAGRVSIEFMGGNGLKVTFSGKARSLSE